jgi:integrase
VTIGELLVLYEKNHVVNLKSARNLSRRLTRYIGPWSALALEALPRMQVVQWHQENGRTRGHSAANQALAELHALYRKAQDWELYDGKNPADHIKKFPRHSRERFVQPHEMPYLLRALAEELPRIEIFFLILLLTGCRTCELRTAKWTHFDLVQKIWHKPVTKNGTSHTIPLADELIRRLQQLPRETVWVFPSRACAKNGMQAGQRCRTVVKWHWERIRKRAGLPDLHIHDLRRTAASWMAIHGENLPVISQMLNHQSITSTQIYARLSITPVRNALNGNAERMLGPVPVPTTLPPQQTMVRAPACGGERDEWPG